MRFLIKMSFKSQDRILKVGSIVDHNMSIQSKLSSVSLGSLLPWVLVVELLGHRVVVVLLMLLFLGLYFLFLLVVGRHWFQLFLLFQHYLVHLPLRGSETPFAGPYTKANCEQQH